MLFQQPDSSFLNEIIRTADECRHWNSEQRKIKKVKLINKPCPEGILFHRDNLLYFISQIILMLEKGNVNITGPNDTRNARDYYKAILLISSKLGKMIIGDKKLAVLKNIFVREYPYYYSSNTLFNI